MIYQLLISHAINMVAIHYFFLSVSNANETKTFQIFDNLINFFFKHTRCADQDFINTVSGNVLFSVRKFLFEGTSFRGLPVCSLRQVKVIINYSYGYSSGQWFTITTINDMQYNRISFAYVQLSV